MSANQTNGSVGEGSFVVTKLMLANFNLRYFRLSYES